MDKYKELISSVNDVLKPYGFRKNGETFYCKYGENIGIVNFQKSRDSTKDSVLFTINLGVYSSALKILDNHDVKLKPTISDCHWRKRVGFLLPNPYDKWWEINVHTSLFDIISELRTILLDLAIPQINRNITDEALVKSWMNGIADGLTEQQMYIYLIALLKANGSEYLDIKVKELKQFCMGKPFERNVKDSLEQIGIIYG